MLTLNIPSASFFQSAFLPSSASQFRDGYINITLNRAGATVRQVAELVLIRLGLSGSTLIDFNIWSGSDFLESAVNQLTKQGVSAYFKQGNGATVSIKIIIKASLIQQMQEFGLTFAQSGAGEFSNTGRISRRTSTLNIAQMSAEEKLTEAIKRAIPMLPSEVQEQLKSLLTPKALAIAVGTLVFWAGSHFFGVGEFVDIILLGVGVAFIGLGVFDGASDLYDFVTIAINAKSDPELTKAAEYFAEAVTVLGVTTITALLMKNSAKTVISRGKPRFYRMANVGPPPPAATPIITRPKTLASGALGETDYYGYIKVTRGRSIPEQKVTLYHEWIHRVLSPKLGPFRQLRAQLNASRYNRSGILRYLEEALAEAYGNYRVYGIKSSIVGITFPLEGGYVTISQLAAEGIAIGNIALGGAQFTVYIGYGNVTPKLK